MRWNAVSAPYRRHTMHRRNLAFKTTFSRGIQYSCRKCVAIKSSPVAARWRSAGTHKPRVAASYRALQASFNRLWSLNLINKASGRSTTEVAN
ncbi:unnamed protein product [Trichogramma brassicae]|uniref:Uncharacterized protein n=1 Tax=Trichogramma brassicae TaxID=86971 RepID=A0A6H5ISY8_9HYME|nr:unnamed protein product [Trichogramma brassicae]